MIDWIRNPSRDRSLAPSGDDAPLRFHSALPGYEPTPLVDSPELAAEWGVGRVLLKFERDVLG